MKIKNIKTENIILEKKIIYLKKYETDIVVEEYRNEKGVCILRRFTDIFGEEIFLADSTKNDIMKL